MNVSKSAIVIGMADGVIEPVIIAVLAHFKHHGLRLHILDQVSNKLGTGCNLHLLLLSKYFLRCQTVLHSNRKDLLLEVLKLHNLLPVFTQVFLFHFKQLFLPLLLLRACISIESIATVAYECRYTREID